MWAPVLPKYCFNCAKEQKEEQSAKFCPNCGNPISMEEFESCEKLRSELLQTYSHETITHGGYIIALVIGALTLISRWRDFEANLWILFLILSLMAGVGTYIAGRMLYWAFLSSHVLTIKINALSINDVKTPMIARMQRKAGADFNRIKNKVPMTYFSNTTRLERRIFLIILVMISMFILLLAMTTFWQVISQFM
jgi:predicted RNA-binding Zn-ribbon protein involved in translation (DUF1610 family)